VQIHTSLNITIKLDIIIITSLSTAMKFSTLIMHNSHECDHKVAWPWHYFSSRQDKINKEYLY
jgi:hypothetical protein